VPSPTPVIYATADWCIHDDRWVAALVTNGFDPICFSVKAKECVVPVGTTVVDSVQDLRREIDAITANESMPILAGPLTTITKHLMGANVRIVGISWGWDLQPEALGEVFDPTSLAWIADLDALIVDSIVTEQIAQNLGLAPDRISNIPWGIDVDLFTPQGSKADLTQWGVGPTDRVVLSLRAHTPIHHVGDIVEAFAISVMQDPKLFLLIGGDGPLRQSLEARVHELGIEHRTTFIGMLPELELPALLRAVDLYVAATAVDGTSVTLLQALACGAPVLVADIPGNLPWIGDEGAETFKVGAVDALGQAMSTGAHATNAMPPLREQHLRSHVNWVVNAQGLAGILLTSD
jgi:glycosyltransferase involved in cell wall biosynthesis